MSKVELKNLGKFSLLLKVLICHIFTWILKIPTSFKISIRINIYLWITNFFFHSYITGTSLMAQLIKNLSAMRETWVRSLGQEDPLEMGKAIHSSILAWRIPWTV